MVKRPELMIMTGDLAGKRFAVPQEGLRLGRSSSNDISIPDEELSRNHCLFEQQGPDGITVVDLASANGTYVNGAELGAEARELAVGDLVEVGATEIRVVDEDTPAPVVPSSAGVVDLGLDAAVSPHAAAAAGADSAKRRAPIANILWLVVILVFGTAIAVVLLFPRIDEPASVPHALATEPAPVDLLSLSYEKVEADARRIFRFRMTIDRNGELGVVYDDVPGENRHVDKRCKLSAKALERIREIFQTRGWSELAPAYTGSSAVGENALTSWRIRTVFGKEIRDVRVENTVEPDAFAMVREALEAFSQNELGIWALQYSREKLVELSAESERIGDAKWAEVDVEYGNLSAAVKAYKEAIFYLDTVNPKPVGYPALREKLSTSEAELARRYKDQRFRADRAINLGDWETAKAELRTLCDMVPERDDPRHAEANAKLVDVENRIKRAKKGGRK
ncbi:MAG: FHA domain-containing protein [Kiritimatiellia bacterium]